jgi:hypothetical protein
MLQLQTTRPPKTFNHHPNIGSPTSAPNPRQAQSFRVERAGTHYGRALLKQDKLPEAIRSFSATVAPRPDLDASPCGLGTALME